MGGTATRERAVDGRAPRGFRSRPRLLVRIRASRSCRRTRPSTAPSPRGEIRRRRVAAAAEAAEAPTGAIANPVRRRPRRARRARGREGETRRRDGDGDLLRDGDFLRRKTARGPRRRTSARARPDRRPPRVFWARPPDLRRRAFDGRRRGCPARRASPRVGPRRAAVCAAGARGDRRRKPPRGTRQTRGR